METLILHLILWVINHGPLDRSSRVNGGIDRAEQAFGKKDYALAGRELRKLIDSLRVTDPAARLDWAHALYESRDTTAARRQYGRLDSIADKSVRTVALQQLGVMDGLGNQHEKALAYFKDALKTDPANEDARYNFELLKKRLQQQQQQQQQQQNEQKDQKDQQQKDKQQKEQEQQQKEQQKKEQEQQQKEQQQKAQDQQQKEDKKGQESEQQKEQDSKDGKESDERERTIERLKQMNLSEEKARMILDAMKNSEIQYLQQRRREKARRPDSDKPDW